MRKHLLLLVTSAVCGVISGTVVAVLTSPFWGWFEDRTGIESLGHSGPADWVFAFVIALCFAISLLVLEIVFRKRPETASGAN